MNNEVYFSTDIETDGPIPGQYSMLSLGCYAVREDGESLGHFYTTIERLPGAGQHPTTMDWWATQPEAYALATKDPAPPQTAMDMLRAWVAQLGGKPVFVGYPAGFDFTFVYWYLIRYGGQSPIGFQALDLKTLAMAILNRPFRQTTKKAMPRHWWGTDTKHTHHALDDAKEQAGLLVSILAEIRSK
jgi:hypothetical protein